MRDILPIYSDILPDLGYQARSSGEVQALAATTHHHVHTQLSALALKLALAGGPRVRGRLRKRRLEVRSKHGRHALALPTGLAPPFLAHGP